MGVELKDFRGRITAETDCVLEGLTQASGKDRQEIVRNILHDWAMEQIHAASVLHQRLRAEGLRGIDGGMRGNVVEPEGTRGNGGRG